MKNGIDLSNHTHTIETLISFAIKDYKDSNWFRIKTLSPVSQKDLSFYSNKYQCCTDSMGDLYILKGLL